MTRTTRKPIERKDQLENMTVNVSESAILGVTDHLHLTALEIEIESRLKIDETGVMNHVMILVMSQF